MDAPDEMPGAEELSFGGDPDREPWLRRWVSAHRKLLLVGAAVLVMLGLIGGGGRYLYEQSRRPLPPPDVALPEQVRFRVKLCNTSYPNCAPKEYWHVRDVGRIAATLWGILEITSVDFLSKEAQYEKWTRMERSASLEDRPAGQVTLSTFTDAFDGALRRSSDFPAVAAQVLDIPGVHDIERVPAYFWTGKADVTVTLCGNSSVEACAPFRSRDVTEEQKQAVLDRIREIDAVEKVFFEDRRHALMLQKHYYPEGTNSGPPMTLTVMKETFRLKMRGSDAVQRVRKELKGFPGVESVTPITPAME